MISTFLANHYLLGRVLIVVVGALVLAVAALLARRGRWGRRVAGVLTGLALVGVLGLTLTPDVPPTPRGPCNLVPVYTFTHPDVPNIALFFAPALFATVATRRPWLVLLAGIGLSAVIETVQRLTAIGRICDVDDLIANAEGALGGVLVGLLLNRLLGPRSTPAPAEA